MALPSSRMDSHGGGLQRFRNASRRVFSSITSSSCTRISTSTMRRNREELLEDDDDGGLTCFQPRRWVSQISGRIIRRRNLGYDDQEEDDSGGLTSFQPATQGRMADDDVDDDHNSVVGNFIPAVETVKANVGGKFIWEFGFPTVEIVSSHVVVQAQCAICIEPFELATKALLLDCGHLHHCKCILPWLSLNRSCPVCRTHIHPKLIFPRITTYI